MGRNGNGKTTLPTLVSGLASLSQFYASEISIHFSYVVAEF